MSTVIREQTLLLRHQLRQSQTDGQTDHGQRCVSVRDAELIVSDDKTTSAENKQQMKRWCVILHKLHQKHAWYMHVRVLLLLFQATKQAK